MASVVRMWSGRLRARSQFELHVALGACGMEVSGWDWLG